MRSLLIGPILLQRTSCRNSTNSLHHTDLHIIRHHLHPLVGHRRHCILLVSVLSRHHPAHILSPYLQKLISAVHRQLRDQDSSVRSTAASAVADLASSGHHPFNTLTKPFFETLFTDPDPNAQSGEAMCLVRIIEEVERNKAGFSSTDVAGLRRVLVKLERLVRNDGFKGKTSALLVVGVEGVVVSSDATKGLVGCLVDFPGSEEWAGRKAAAGALWRMAAVGVAEDKGMLSEFKASCLKTFEAKRFDKVKGVRETMNQMIEAWKEIPDLADEPSQAMSKGNAGDRYLPTGSKTSVASSAPQLKSNNTRTRLNDVSPLSMARKRSPLSGNEKKKQPAMFRKLDSKKPSYPKPETAPPPPNRNPGTLVSESSPPLYDEDKEDVLTVIAGLEGFHNNVDGRHVSSFPYGPDFTLENATGFYVNGDVDIGSEVVAGLPSSHSSTAPMKHQEFSH